MDRKPIDPEALSSMLESAADNAQHWRDQEPRGGISRASWQEDIDLIESLPPARILAAAPEMLEALDHLIAQAEVNDAGEWHDAKAFRRYVVTIARAAIAKATGGAA